MNELYEIYDEITADELAKALRWEFGSFDKKSKGWSMTHGFDAYPVLFQMDQIIYEILNTDTLAFSISEDEHGRVKKVVRSDHYKILPLLISVDHSMYENLSLGEYVQVFLDTHKSEEIAKYGLKGDVKPDQKVNYGLCAAQVANKFVDAVRRHPDLDRVRAKQCQRNYNARENFNNSVRQILELLYMCDRLLVCRVDLGYGEEISADITPQRVNDDLENFKNKVRKRKFFKHCVGSFVRIEQAPVKGYHMHCIFLFDGRERRSHKYISESIGKYWVDVITDDEGVMFNCNRKKGGYYYSYVGMIEKNDIDKLKYLIKYGIGYLTKTEQVVKARLSNASKTFRRSHITEHMKQRIERKRLREARAKELEDSDVESNEPSGQKPNAQSPELNPESLNIRLGTDHNGYAVYWQPVEEDNGFFRIMGASGSGKTEALKWITYQLCQQGMPVLLFDFHGDVIVPGMESILLSSGRNSYFGVNPMELDVSDFNHTGLDDQIEELFEMVKQAFDNISPRQSEILYMALEEAYSQAGIVESDSSTWRNPAPKFSDVINILAELAKDPPSGTRSASYTSCIAAIRKLFRHKIFDREYNLTVPYFATRAVRLDLSGPGYDIKFVVTETILKMLFKAARAAGPVSMALKGSKQKFRIFVVIDEASILCMGQGDPNSQRTILNVLMREARKFGIAIVVASQMSSHFGRDVTANAAAALVLKTSDPKETRNNADSIGMDAQDVLQLSEVGMGHFKAKSSNTVSMVKIEPGKTGC